LQQALKQKKTKSPCQLAIEHFDLHYKPIYDLQWPSVRVALLSKPKHCALVNNFALDPKQIGISLAELGAYNFIWTAREKFVRIQLKDAGGSASGISTERVSVLQFLQHIDCIFTARQHS